MTLAPMPSLQYTPGGAMIEILHKTLVPVGVKVSPGRVEAAFSVFNNIDSDNDIVVPGAIENGAEIMVSAWGHGSWQPGILPIGRGVVHTTSSEAVVTAEFFDTVAAAETLEVLRGLGELCQWSFGYRVLESDFTTTVDGRRIQLLNRLQVTEASPVLLGANDRTRTLAVSGSDDPAEVTAREYSRFAARELDRQLAEELGSIRSGLEGAA